MQNSQVVVPDCNQRGFGISRQVNEIQYGIAFVHCLERRQLRTQRGRVKADARVVDHQINGIKVWPQTRLHHEGLIHRLAQCVVGSIQCADLRRCKGDNECRLPPARPDSTGAATPTTASSPIPATADGFSGREVDEASSVEGLELAKASQNFAPFGGEYLNRNTGLHDRLVEVGRQSKLRSWRRPACRVRIVAWVHRRVANGLGAAVVSKHCSGDRPHEVARVNPPRRLRPTVDQRV